MPWDWIWTMLWVFPHVALPLTWLTLAWWTLAWWTFTWWTLAWWTFTWRTLAWWIFTWWTLAWWTFTLRHLFLYSRQLRFLMTLSLAHCSSRPTLYYFCQKIAPLMKVRHSLSWFSSWFSSCAWGLCLAIYSSPRSFPRICYSLTGHGSSLSLSFWRIQSC